MNEYMMVIKKEKVNSVVRRNRKNGRKSQTFSFSLSDQDINALDQIKEKLGTFNRSHSVSALIENYASPNTNRKIVNIIPTDMPPIVGNEIDIDSCIKAYIDLFETGKCSDIKISKRGEEVINIFYEDISIVLKTEPNRTICKQYVERLQHMFNSFIATHVDIYRIAVAQLNICHTESERKIYIDSINSMRNMEYIIVSNIVRSSQIHRFSLFLFLKDDDFIKNLKRVQWTEQQTRAIALMNKKHPVNS